MCVLNRILYSPETIQSSVWNYQKYFYCKIFVFGLIYVCMGACWNERGGKGEIKGSVGGGGVNRIFRFYVRLEQIFEFHIRFGTRWIVYPQFCDATRAR